ncbi:agropine synthesis reductase [Triticum aestivum]|nr:agropine synthesis reductase-like [Triticum aestivum]
MLTQTLGSFPSSRVRVGQMEGSTGNSPAPPPAFRNRYWILRHGRSVPNERGLIVSSLENGTKPEFGLAPQGVEQARSAGESLRKELEEMGVPVDSVKICYSPFSRTTETARVVAGVLGVPFEGPSCKATVELRERYFGPSYELLSHEKYAEVWAIDEADPFLAPEGGESVADVASRLAGVLSSADVEFHGSAVLIVSHGDPLQIFQAVLSGAKENPSFLDDASGLRKESLVISSVLSQHRKFALNTAELRRVV